MNTIYRFFTCLVMFLTITSNTQAQQFFDEETKAQNWYADRCEGAILRFEGTRHDSGKLPQKFCIFPLQQAKPLGYAMVIAPYDESELIMFTPNGNDIKAQRITKDVIPQEIYWTTISNLGRSRSYTIDITLRERPIAIRNVDKASNSFLAVVDGEDRITDIKAYNQMFFKPHRNGVRLVKQHQNKKIDEQGTIIKDEMEYTFKLNNPSVISKMFRGYTDEEACPWVVKSSFFNHHQPLQYSRWKEGEAIKKATSDACRIISSYYGGRKIKDTRWLATIESGERSFYAVQFENQGTDALAAMVCIGEGEVTSVWEFHGKVEPGQEGQSIWFVDDEGDFMSHAPEIHGICATDEGMELYIRLFGGESVQYYILRKMGSVWMELLVDYWIYVWD